jgi:hypothetical protein
VRLGFEDLSLMLGEHRVVELAAEHGVFEREVLLVNKPLVLVRRSHLLI